MKGRLFRATFLLVAALQAAGCEMTGGYNIPPAERLMEPGPGVGGPGPGVLMAPPPSVAQAAYVTPGGDGAACPPGGFDGGMAGGVATAGEPVQVLFASPESMYVFWDISGMGDFQSTPLVTPGRTSFQSGAIYRLKITNILGREGVELYPTIEIAPPTFRSAAFLAHSAIPIQFTEEDLDQVLTGNFVTKVVYLPDPEFQEMALAGVRTLVSTRLDPGLDPIVEADRRGAILAIIRVGNKDMELPGVTGGSVIPAHYQQFSQTDAGVVPAGIGSPAARMAAGHGVAQASGMVPGYGGIVDPMAVSPDAACVDGYAVGPGGIPAGLAANATGAQYGMPITGTPIGLPGPPHVPLGVPAGLQKHVMHNWTATHLPKPTEQLKINVKQRPGLSYPHPANRAWVVEDTIHPTPHFSHHHFGVPPTGHQEVVAAPKSGLSGGILGKLFGVGKH